MDTILVANAGSSSVKFQVFVIDPDSSLKRQIKGQIDGVGSRPRLRATAADGSILMDRKYENEAVPDVRDRADDGGDMAEGRSAN